MSFGQCHLDAIMFNVNVLPSKDIQQKSTVKINPIFGKPPFFKASHCESFIKCSLPDSVAECFWVILGYFSKPEIQSKIYNYGLRLYFFTAVQIVKVAPPMPLKRANWEAIKKYSLNLSFQAFRSVSFIKFSFPPASSIAAMFLKGFWDSVAAMFLKDSGRSMEINGGKTGPWPWDSRGI